MTQCTPYTTFKNVDSISEDFLLNNLETNFKTFFDWAFLCIGAWFDAKIDEYNVYSSTVSNSQLFYTTDPEYIDGQVWQGIRKDWVWESGINFNNTSPIAISGAYIDNIFYSYPSGEFSVDYPNGRVIFDTPIPVSAKVEMNYSYRNIQTYRANDNPWFSQLQYGTYNNSDIDIQRNEDGNWSISGNHRLQMPAIVIESVARSRSRPYELGNDNLILEQDIAFYVLTETKNERNKLLDIIRIQQDLTTMLYDTNALSKNDEYPLEWNGDLRNNPLMYPGIVNKYPWHKCFLKNVQLFEIDSPRPDFFMGMVKATAEIIGGF